MYSYYYKSPRNFLKCFVSSLVFKIYMEIYMCLMFSSSIGLQMLLPWGGGDRWGVWCPLGHLLQQAWHRCLGTEERWLNWQFILSIFSLCVLVPLVLVWSVLFFHFGLIYKSQQKHSVKISDLHEQNLALLFGYFNFPCCPAVVAVGFVGPYKICLNFFNILIIFFPNYVVSYLFFCILCFKIQVHFAIRKSV